MKRVTAAALTLLRSRRGKVPWEDDKRWPQPLSRLGTVIDVHTTAPVHVSSTPLVASKVLSVHGCYHRSSRSMGQPEEKSHTF